MSFVGEKGARMGRITADTGELREIAASIDATAGHFGYSSMLDIGSVLEPRRTSKALPDYQQRWNRWIDELESTLASLALGLRAAADLYDEQEATIAGWSSP